LRTTGVYSLINAQKDNCLIVFWIIKEMKIQCVGMMKILVLNKSVTAKVEKGEIELAASR